MPKSEKNIISKKIAFLDFRPAEFKGGNDWLVVYHVKNPKTNLMERKRVRVPVISNKAERLKYAKKMVFEINKKLDSGWSPFLETNCEKYKRYDDAIKIFVREITKENKDKIKRVDTLRAYNSYINLIDTYCKEKNKVLNFVFDLNKQFVLDYLNWVYMERNNSPITYNNHLTFLKNLGNFFINKGFVLSNPTTGILPKRKPQKIRVLIDDDVKQKLKKYSEVEPDYFTLCMLTYFCFFRRTELTKLKVSDVNIKDYLITIRGDDSKNAKTETVTIPINFVERLRKHIENAGKDDYLFSTNFKIGKIQLNPKKISDTWSKFRKLYDVKNEVQFYSLKDSGITELLEAGVPAIKVRNQARHYDISITEKYTHRNKFSDEAVVKANFDF